MNNDSRTMTVAAGIVRDARGRVLVNQRPAGKAFAGKWEFPGGKIDSGETTAQALERELDEELGIAVQRQRPLIAFPYEYDDFTVRLRVNEVLDYKGEPAGREGQAIDWVEPEHLGRLDLLAANAPIVRAVVLPRACLITDTERFGVERTLELLARHTAARRVMVIVREKTMDRRELEGFVDRALAICWPRGSRVCMHADCDPDTDRPRADGVHWPARALERGALPAATGLVGVSCHSLDEIRAATRLGADYVLLSPVKRTGSHPDAEPLGWQRFAAICNEAATPVYALGGLSLDDQEEAFAHGAQGPAILSAAWR